MAEYIIRGEIEADTTKAVSNLQNFEKVLEGIADKFDATIQRIASASNILNKTTFNVKTGDLNRLEKYLTKFESLTKINTGSDKFVASLSNIVSAASIVEKQFSGGLVSSLEAVGNALRDLGSQAESASIKLVNLIDKVNTVRGSMVSRSFKVNLDTKALQENLDIFSRFENVMKNSLNTLDSRIQQVGQSFKDTGVSQFAGSLNRAGTAVDKMAEKVRIATRDTRELSIDIRALNTIFGLLGYSAFANQIKSISSSIIQTTADFQNYRSSILAVTKDMEKANNVFAMIQQYSIKTPFQFKEVAEGTIKLEAITSKMEGFKISTKEALELAGEMAMTYGKDLPTAIDTVSKVLGGSAEGVEMLRNNFAVTRPEMEKFGVAMNHQGGVYLRTSGEIKNLILAMKQIQQQVSGMRGLELRQNNLSVQLEAIQDNLAKLRDAIGSSVAPVLRQLLQLMNNILSIAQELPKPFLAFIAVLVLTAGSIFALIEKMAGLVVIIYGLQQVFARETGAAGAQVVATEAQTAALAGMAAAAQTAAAAQAELTAAIIASSAAQTAQSGLLAPKLGQSLAAPMISLGNTSTISGFALGKSSMTLAPIVESTSVFQASLFATIGGIVSYLVNGFKAVGVAISGFMGPLLAGEAGLGGFVLALGSAATAIGATVGGLALLVAGTKFLYNEFKSFNLRRAALGWFGDKGNGTNVEYAQATAETKIGIINDLAKIRGGENFQQMIESGSVALNSDRFSALTQNTPKSNAEKAAYLKANNARLKHLEDVRSTLEPLVDLGMADEKTTKLFNDMKTAMDTIIENGKLLTGRSKDGRSLTMLDIENTIKESEARASIQRLKGDTGGSLLGEISVLQEQISRGKKAGLDSDGNVANREKMLQLEVKLLEKQKERAIFIENEQKLIEKERVAGKEFVSIEEKITALRAEAAAIGDQTADGDHRRREIMIQIKELQLEQVKNNRTFNMLQKQTLNDELDYKLAQARKESYELEAIHKNHADREKLLLEKQKAVIIDYYSNIRQIALETYNSIEENNKKSAELQLAKLGLQEQLGYNVISDKRKEQLAANTAERNQINNQIKNEIQNLKDQIEKQKLTNPRNIPFLQEQLRQKQQQLTLSDQTYNEKGNQINQNAVIELNNRDIEQKLAAAENLKRRNSNFINSAREEYSKSGSSFLQSQILEALGEERKIEIEILKLQYDKEAKLKKGAELVELTNKFLLDQNELNKQSFLVMQKQSEEARKARREKEDAEKAAFLKRGEPTMGGIMSWEDMQKKDAEAAQKAAEERRLRIRAEEDRKEAERDFFINQRSSKYVQARFIDDKFNSKLKSGYDGGFGINPFRTLEQNREGVGIGQYAGDSLLNGKAGANPINKFDAALSKLVNMENKTLDANITIKLINADGKELGSGKVQHGSQIRAENPYPTKHSRGGL